MDDNKPEIETEKPVSNTNSSNSDSKVENSVESTPVKVGDGSEYESAEDDGEKVPDKSVKEYPKDQESLSELVDEEGGEEGIAEPEDVEGDFLSGVQPDEINGEIDDVGASHVDKNYVGGIDEGVAGEADAGDIVEADKGDVDEADEGGVDEANEGGVDDTNEVDVYEANEVDVYEADGDIDEADEGDIDEADEGDIDEADEGDVDEADENSDEYADERQLGDDEGSEEGEYVEEERQQGDGEECSPVNAVTEKELDFDEDRRNPQYIPKKGIFYEHDDRNNEDVKEKDEEPSRDRKKKLWLDEGKWGHDRFRLEEQYPKSKHELIETYGYDIRNEDGPPRARRRRRYGRGPTKYIRNWEDVTAYGREKFRGNPRGNFGERRASGGRFRGAPRFRGRGRKEFISDDSGQKSYLSENTDDHEEPSPKEDKEIDNKATVPVVINSSEFPALPSKDPVIESEVIVEKRPYFQKSLSEVPESNSVRTLTFENSNLSGRNSLERDVPALKTKSVVYGRQPDKNMTQIDISVAQTSRNLNQFEKSINNHEKYSNQQEKYSNQHEKYYEKYSSQHEKYSNQHEKYSNQHDKYSNQHDKYSNQHDKYSNQHDKYSNQHEKYSNQHEKYSNQHEKYSNQHEKNVNYHERSANQHERNFNQHDRHAHQFEKNVNVYDRNIKHLERSNSFHEKNVTHSQHDRGIRKPVSRGGRGSGRGDYIRRGRGSGMRHISPRFLENKVNLSSDMEQLNIADVAEVCNGVNTEKIRQIDNDIVPTSESEITNMFVKGTGDASSRPKRYSSLRQRSLPETTSYQASQPAVPTQASAYYESGYQPALYAPTNTGVPTPSTQSQSATSPPLMNPSGFHPYDCGIRLQLLPRAIFPQPTLPAGQSVLAPPPPSPCIPPPPNANLMDFAPPPPPSGYHQYAYQQYAQPPPPPPPTAPSDIYQPGITYYFAQQTQSTSTRPTVQKRPKAAIPILPPPDRESKKDENKEVLHTSSNSSRNSSNDAINGEVPSLRTDSSQQLSSVGVES